MSQAWFGIGDEVGGFVMIEGDLKEVDVLEKLTRLFCDLGSPQEQANVMAKQLWKRSSQVARERDVKQVVALNELLSLAISGSQGIGPQDITPVQG